MDQRRVQDRLIRADERSGVMVPANLPRFAAAWLQPADQVSDVVDVYWSVRWNLPPNQSVVQRILEFPAVTLSVESGAVPAPFVVTAVQRRAWSRTIAGRGEVFAIRLRPAGLAVVSDLDPATLCQETTLTRATDKRARRFLEFVREGRSPEERARLADTAIRELLSERPPAFDQLLANAVIDKLAARVRLRAGQKLADELDVSQRSIQRALRKTLGMGPKAVARRIRLQEVVRRLSRPTANVAAIAAELGYVDQAHLINDFRGVAGTTPGQYLQELQVEQSSQ